MASVLYYGLSLKVGSFGLDIYHTQFIFGFVEIPADLGASGLSQHFGRRKCEGSFLFLGGTACLVVLAIPNGTFSTLLFFHDLKMLFVEVEIFQCLFNRCGTCFSDMYYFLLRCSSGSNSHSCTGENGCHCLFQHSLHLHCKIIPNRFEVMSLFPQLFMITK